MPYSLLVSLSFQVMLNLTLDTPLNIHVVTALVPVKKQTTIYSENSNLWFHKQCLKINSAVFEVLAISSVSWICCNCGLPTFSSSLFLSFSSFDCKNSFDLLQILPEQDQDNSNPFSKLSFLLPLCKRLNLSMTLPFLFGTEVSAS